jgi:aminocarboxymuconate-semialdehyde decarboxylase
VQVLLAIILKGRDHLYDVHTHTIPPAVLRWLLDNHAQVNAKWTKKDPNKAEFLSVNGKWEFELKEPFVNPNLYLSEQEKAGIIHSLVSPIPQLFLYDFPSEITKELSAVYNDSLIEWACLHTSRLSVLATLPMNEPAAAAAELERAMNRGAKGAIVASSWSGRGLCEEEMIPFWEAANERSAIVFVHPLLCEDPRLRKAMMANLIGVPWETTVCGLDLMLSGILERYPKVRILLAHGGGFLPYQVGRLQTGYAKWESVSSKIKASPSELIRRFWFDTVLWNPAGLQYLIEIVGEDKVVPGSDYPFDLCEWPPNMDGTKGFQSLMSQELNF